MDKMHSNPPCKSLYLSNTPSLPQFTFQDRPISENGISIKGIARTLTSKHSFLIWKKPNFSASINFNSMIQKHPIASNPVCKQQICVKPRKSCSFPNSPIWKNTHVVFSSSRPGSALESTIDEEDSNPKAVLQSENKGVKETELELLGKPMVVSLPTTITENQEVSDPPKPEKDEALAPFLKFFKANDSVDESEEMIESELINEVKKDVKEVNVEYYEPKSGDLAVGIVVSGNENKLDINIGADLLGTMLTKEVLPLYDEEFPHLLCDLGKDVEEFMVPGKTGVVKDEEALGGELIPGRPVVETGTVIFAVVLGRTLSGRPLLSTRRLTRQIAWHRVRQIKQLNEPMEVRITEWNTGGLLARIEGLRAFLPKAELMSRVNNFTALKQNVGRRISVKISRIDEANNDLIISEREAWDMSHLQEGTLLEGTVLKIFPYGAQVRIGDTNRSGLLHISNITCDRIASVDDLLSVDEKVKVLVVKSMFPKKISLSIVDLESEPSLFLKNKERVFAEAEEMAVKFRRRLPVVSANRGLDQIQSEKLPFDNEAGSYSNWNWFKFEQVNDL